MCVRVCAFLCSFGFPGHVGLCMCLHAYASLTQNAVLMRHIVLPFVVCLAASYFSTLSHKRHDFLKTVTDLKTGGLIFSASLI